MKMHGKPQAQSLVHGDFQGTVLSSKCPVVLFLHGCTMCGFAHGKVSGEPRGLSVQVLLG